MSSNTFGSLVAKAVPTWTAEAPAKRNSTASRQFVIPPQPKMGVSGKASKMSYTHRKAMGLMAGPERPPRMLLRTGI